MTYRPDPGGVFASDTHRRTLGHLPNPPDPPTTVGDFVVRMGPDAHTDLGEDDASEVLSDLEADGHAEQKSGGWKQTKAGLAALCAPVPGED